MQTISIERKNPKLQFMNYKGILTIVSFYLENLIFNYHRVWFAWFLSDTNDHEQQLNCTSVQQLVTTNFYLILILPVGSVC